MNLHAQLLQYDNIGSFAKFTNIRTTNRSELAEKFTDTTLGLFTTKFKTRAEVICFCRSEKVASYTHVCLFRRWLVLWRRWSRRSGDIKITGSSHVPSLETIAHVNTPTIYEIHTFTKPQNFKGYAKYGPVSAHNGRTRISELDLFRLCYDRIRLALRLPDSILNACAQSFTMSNAMLTAAAYAHKSDIFKLLIH